MKFMSPGGIATLLLLASTACSGTSDDSLPASLTEPELQDNTTDSAFTVVNGKVYYEGDIIVGEADEFDEAAADDLDNLMRTKAAGTFDLSRGYQANLFGTPWPFGQVYYKFHSSVAAGSAKRTEFLNATTHYEQWTSLDFIETPANYVGPYVLVRADDTSAVGCASFMGMIGSGAQDFDIGRANCNFGSILHELGHAVGLFHEHQRADRNSFVTVGDSSDATNCARQSSSASTSRYDLGSIMHYYQSSCGGITPVGGGSFVAQRTALSPLDIQGIQVMYGTEFDKAVTTVRRGTGATGTTEILVNGAADGFVWRAQKTSTTFVNFESLGGPDTDGNGTADPIIGAPAGASWSNSRLDVFARGRNSELYRKSWNGSSWSPSQTGWTRVTVAPRMASSPIVVSWGSNNLDVFYKRTDLQVAHVYMRNNGAWTSEILGGNILGNPRVVSWGAGRMDVIALGTDQRMYHKAFANGAWSPSTTAWNDLVGNFRGTPTITSWGSNRLDIFGRGTDGKLYHKAWAGQWSPSQSGWNNLGENLSSNPEAVTWGVNRLDVVFRGTTGVVRWKRWDGTQWLPSQTTSTSIGGSVIGTPGITSWGSNRLDVFARGAGDNSLWDNTMNNANSTWTGWTDREGSIGW